MQPEPYRSSEFRFYEELNDFLPPEQRRVSFRHRFRGTPSVKDRIEALGIPHTEVDLILVNGASVDFSRKLQGGERVAVYPVFETLDITSVTQLRPEPLRVTRFVLDVHLGRLANYLRLLGFDCLYRNDLGDEEIICLALAQQRIVLTRDIGLLKDGRVTHGAFLHATRPLEQVREVIRRFQLEQAISPFTRCSRCNGTLEPAPDEALDTLVPPWIRHSYDSFSRCRRCGQVYWPGDHYQRLRQRFRAIGIELDSSP